MSKMSVDFSGVSDSEYAQPGKYIAKVKDITKESGKEYPYLKWELVIMSGKSKGASINHITSLKPSALFNLRNTLIACGFNIPKSAIAIDFDKVKGKTLGIEVTNREYEGKDYANVKSVFPPSDLTEVTIPTSTTISKVTTDPDDMVLDLDEDTPF